MTSTRALPWTGAVLLALLGLPRVVLHDLGVIDEGSGPNAVLVWVPVLVWLAVLAIRWPEEPLRNGLRLGAAYAVVLVATHQLLWTHGHVEPPRLGGNLSDLPDAAHTVIVRAAATGSSVVTGLLVGLAVALVAWAVRRASSRFTGRPGNLPPGRQ